MYTQLSLIGTPGKRYSFNSKYKPIELLYMDYYGYAASIQLEIPRTIFDLGNNVLKIDTHTIPQFDKTEKSTDGLVSDFSKTLTSSYNLMFQIFSNEQILQKSFVELSKHIIKKNQVSDIDEFLTLNGLKVFRSYASFSTIYANESISETNIR